MKKKIQLPPTVAEIQLSYRTKVKLDQCPKVNSSASAYKVFIESWDKSQIDFRELMRVMLLNKVGRVLGILDLGFGGTSAAIVEPKLIFVAAIRANAYSIILAHNHPSGETKPSDADNSLTKRLVEGGKLLAIPIHDHLIITENGYFSYADQRLL